MRAPCFCRRVRATGWLSEALAEPRPRGLLGVLLAAVVLPLWMPGEAEAAVRILTRPDGTKYVYDDRRPASSGWTSGRLLPVKQGEIADLIDYYATDRGLSPKLVQAVIQVESAYDPRARSSKGAMGLMQLMPGTAKQLRVADPYDPGQNIRGGTLYLRRQLDRFDGDLKLALAAYNAGPGAVTQYGGVPPYKETRNYVQKVLGLYRGHSASSASRPSHSQQVASRQESNVRQGSKARQAPRQVAAKDKAGARSPGKKVYMSRGGNNRITFTTAPPRTY